MSGKCTMCSEALEKALQLDAIIEKYIPAE
jgi:hypothetical protein